MNKNIKVPFFNNKQQVKSCNWSTYKTKDVDNYIFETTLEYSDQYSSRSGIHIIWKDLDNGKTYISTQELMDKALKGELTQVVGDKYRMFGKFTFTKRNHSVFLTNVKK